LLRLLDQKLTHAGIPRLRVILDALYDDEWMAYLRHWRRTCGTSEPVYSLDTFLSSNSDPASPQMAVTWDKLDTIERCKQAVKGFTGYIRRMPHAARGYMGRAEAYWYWGQFANARDDFARALEHARTADDQLRILSGRGQVIAEMVCWGTAPKDHDAEQQGCAEALKDLDQVIESASWVGYRLTVAYARSARALVRAKQRQDAEADQDLEESLAVNPNNAWAYYHRGLVEELRGRTEAAIDAFTQALKKTH